MFINVSHKSLVVVFLFFGLFYAKAQDWEQDYNKGWKVLSVKDSAFSYFNKARSIAIKHDSLEGVIYSSQSLMYVSGYHYDLVKFEKYIQLFKEDSKMVKDAELKAYAKSIYLFENINYNYKSREYNRAKKYIDSLFHFIKTSPADIIKSTKNNLYESASKYQASIYKHQEQFEQARETYRKLLNYIEINTSDPDELLGKQFSIYRLLSQTHAAAGDLEKAIGVEKRLLSNQDIKENYLSTNSGITLVLTHITNLIEVGHFQEARNQLLLLPQKIKLNPLFLITDLENRARLSYEEKNYELALQQLEEAIIVATDYNKDNSKPEIINLYLRKAEFLKDLGNYGQAFEIYNNLINQLNKSKNDVTFINKRLKIKVLNGLFSNENSEKMDAVEIKNLITQLINAIDFLQPQFESAADRQFLIKSTFETIQKAFDLNATSYFKTGDKKAVELAFQLSEKYRVISLRQDFVSQNLELDQNIDPAFIKEEKQLKSQIFYLQNKINSNPLLRDSLFLLNKNYKVLKKKIKKESPEFYAFKFGNNIKNIKYAQSFLEDDQAFLSYFFGVKNLYIISIDTDNYQLEKIAWNSEDASKLDKLLSSISTVNRAKKVSIENLSSKILKPITNLKKDRYIIIPDGTLHHLPFEVLLYKGKELLQSAAISYEESISLFIETSTDNLNKTHIDAYTPFTENEISSDLISGYAPLNFAKQELVFPLLKMDTELFMGKEASLSRFRESVKNIKPKTQHIFHIASHAAVNYENVNESYILFKGNKPEKLVAQEVYNLKMDNSFVILSACETGIGQVIKGEGMRSFSQAFRYAGAKSLLHSKWKVSDKSTAFIMNAFYEELATGKTKEIALQQAKLTYLKQAPDAQSRVPYYWAGLVITGDIAALPLHNSNTFIYLFLGIVLLIITGYFLKKRKQ